MLNLEEMRHEKNPQGSSNNGSSVQDFPMKIFSTAFGSTLALGSLHNAIILQKVRGKRSKKYADR